MRICLQQHTALVEEHPSLLGQFQDAEFWERQIKHAMEMGYEKALPQHRLVRMLPIRNWKHRRYLGPSEWTLLLDSDFRTQ